VRRPRLRRLTVPSSVAFALGLAVLSGPRALCAQYARTTSAVAGPHYHAGWLHRLMLGAHYRDLWGSPLAVEVLDLSRFAGGLTPIRCGGRPRRRCCACGVPTGSVTPSAREAGVEHYVYTSVGSANKRTGIPHFDNKSRIEETVRGLRFPSHVILRPVAFMENLLAPYSLQGDTLTWALGPSTKLQMIAVDDIGWFGARAFTAAAALNRREIDIAGDVRTMPEVARS